jgi:glycosyltransferase involved in cell wall biosynthesis
MPHTVLIEGHNVTLARGTGIATYARVLGATLRNLGFDTELLIGTRRNIDVSDPVLSEVCLFDANAEARPPFLQRATRSVVSVIGTPFGMTTTPLRRSNAVVDAIWSQLGSPSQVHTVCDLTDLARLHFKRHGRPARLRLPKTPSLFHATQAVPLAVPGCPNIYTVHDLVPLRLPSATLDDKKYFFEMVREIARRADHIVTVSETSRRDIIDIFGVSPDRITNTYQSVHLPQALLDRPEAELAEQLQANFDLGLREYFLFVGAIEPKKNIARLLDAYASAGSKYPLVIVGSPGWQCEGDLAKINDERFLAYRVSRGMITPHRRVRRLDYLPLPRLVALLRGARAVLFPSLYEGFGLPVLEAMVAGSPVLTSRAASLPEIAGDAALLVDPYDVDEMAAGIRKLDQDADLRQALIVKGRERARLFSPECYEERVASLYRRLLG